MNRRTMLAGLACLATVGLTGCNKLSFLPQARRKTVGGYDAVQTGMNETQVRKYLGEPVRRRRINLEGENRPVVAMTFLIKQHLITVTLENGVVIDKNRV